jgi:hypothetical protein
MAYADYMDNIWHHAVKYTHHIISILATRNKQLAN